MRISVAGENSFILYFDEKPSSELTASIQQTVIAIDTKLSQYLIDLVPSYASILVIYDQTKIDYRRFRKAIGALINTTNVIHSEGAETEGKLVELPVYYGEDAALDLNALAQRAKLTTNEVVNIHQAKEYRVYAIGFAPGFAYLGEVDKRIATPRLETPRLKVPKGAVAIADKQTAVYPAESPGGWNIIGRCPLSMFNSGAQETMPVSVGDRVKFTAISRQEYFNLGGEL
ncbi:MAG: 5-oxoprolinase subunit PxpB [Cellvibrionaceae bacterium]